MKDYLRHQSGRMFDNAFLEASSRIRPRTPFLFYIVGGYLALKGQLDVGQLVAVITAYKDLPGPLKELIDWDQLRQDVQVKYTQVVEQFSVDNLIDDKVQALGQDAVPHREEPLAASNLSLSDDSGARLVSNRNCRSSACCLSALMAWNSTVTSCVLGHRCATAQ